MINRTIGITMLTTLIDSTMLPRVQSKRRKKIIKLFILKCKIFAIRSLIRPKTVIIIDRKKSVFVVISVPFEIT